jgi:GT2 family glycosyltransferase
MNTAVGLVTFGNTAFTIMTVKSILETSSVGEKDIFIVVGQPGDSKTLNWLAATDINIAKIHTENMGFPASINDIYDAVWKDKDYDNLIIMGNDVIAYPHAINSLIKIAQTTDNEWICAREVDVKTLYKDFPEVQKYFEGPNYNFYAFEARPWEVFKNYSIKIDLDEAGLSDVHNMTLFKKSVMEKVGYVDVSFYPAYYEDNDYCKRALLTDVKSCSLNNARYFHFWSRTFKQGEGGSTHRYFNNNKKYYIEKWGGDFLKEKFLQPFNGETLYFGGSPIEPFLNIQSREYELNLVRYWRSLVNASN